MSEIHLPEHSSPIKNWKHLLVVAVLSFAVPVLLILAIVQIITGGLAVDPTSLAMSEEAIAARLKPVGEVRLEPAGSAAAAAAPTMANAQPAAGPAAKARSGEEVVQQACAACHATGLAGAPKAGDKAAWKPRIAQGVPTLYTTRAQRHSGNAGKRRQSEPVRRRGQGRRRLPGRAGQVAATPDRSATESTHRRPPARVSPFFGAGHGSDRQVLCALCARCGQLSLSLAPWPPTR